MADIVFTTRLTEADWDETFGGWRCPPLAVPGAVVEAIYVEGTRIDTKRYEVLPQFAIIRWSSSDRPPRALATIELTEKLTLGTDTDRWKKLAIIFPVIATILAAVISGVATFYSRARVESVIGSVLSVPPPPQPKHDEPIQTAEDNTTSRQAMVIPLGQAVKGVVTSQHRWYKFLVDPGSSVGSLVIHLLIRNVGVRGCMRSTLA